MDMPEIAWMSDTLKKFMCYVSTVYARYVTTLFTTFLSISASENGTCTCLIKYGCTSKHTFDYGPLRQELSGRENVVIELS